MEAQDLATSIETMEKTQATITQIMSRYKWKTPEEADAEIRKLKNAATVQNLNGFRDQIHSKIREFTLAKSIIFRAEN